MPRHLTISRCIALAIVLVVSATAGPIACSSSPDKKNDSTPSEKRASSAKTSAGESQDSETRDDGAESADAEQDSPCGNPDWTRLPGSMPEDRKAQTREAASDASKDASTDSDQEAP
jgi:hypothetical protein